MKAQEFPRKSAAIYHFTNRSEKRPCVYQKQLNQLKSYAEELGYIVDHIYCDFSLKVCEQVEKQKMLEEIHNYDALIMKDFYHLAEHTMAMFSLMKRISSLGVKIHTLLDGSFTFAECPFTEELSVASYYYHQTTGCKLNDVITLRNEVMQLFVKKKTSWHLKRQHCDQGPRRTDREQSQLFALITESDRYNLLIVPNFNDLHWRSARFCKIRKQLGLNIYSMEDGYLPYGDCN